MTTRIIHFYSKFIDLPCSAQTVAASCRVAWEKGSCHGNGSKVAILLPSTRVAKKLEPLYHPAPVSFRPSLPYFSCHQPPFPAAHFIRPPSAGAPPACCPPALLPADTPAVGGRVRYPVSVGDAALQSVVERLLRRRRQAAVHRQTVAGQLRLTQPHERRPVRLAGRPVQPPAHGEIPARLAVHT